MEIVFEILESPYKMKNVFGIFESFIGMLVFVLDCFYFFWSLELVYGQTKFGIRISILHPFPQHGVFILKFLKIDFKSRFVPG